MALGTSRTAAPVIRHISGACPVIYPVPGDDNGSGHAGAAVFRPANSTWFISPVGAAPYQVQFGLQGDIPVPGDFDGDGKTDVAVFRPANGTWFIQGSNAGYWEYQWGLPGDIPVPGDFDGDGKTDIATFRPSNGTWYIQGSSAGYWTYQWGLPGDIPIPGDYDGDGRSGAAVFRPSNNTWYVATTSSGAFAAPFGTSGDIPLTSAYFNFLASTSPTVSLTNLTHPNLAPNFETGDTYSITVIGTPNQPVSMVQTVNGSTSLQSFGNTDSYGRLVINYVEQTGNIGSYTQVWSVGGIQASPAVSFMVGQLGGGTVSTTELGVTTDGHVVGVSTLSIANGSAATYSATELDYTASLYYDAGTVGTLYEEGTPIRSGSASNSGLADGYMSAPATAWKDYDLQTDHYVIAYIPYGIYFENPFYYQDGSCGDVSSDCTFGPGGGIYYVTAASIYLGARWRIRLMLHTMVATFLSSTIRCITVLSTPHRNRLLRYYF
jgi:hypothetical protein